MSRHVGTNVDFDWSDEKTEQLRAYWAAGLSGAEIAAKLRGGLSRMAVLGKARRLGLPARTDAARAAIHKGNTPRGERLGGFLAPAVERNTKIANGLNLKAEPCVPVQSKPSKPFNAKGFTPLPGVEPVALLDLKLCHCRWPVGGEGAEMMSCGAHTDDGPYCPTHARVARSATQPAYIRSRAA